MTANDPLTCGFLKIKVFDLLVRDTFKLGKNSNCTVDKSNTYQIHCQEIKQCFDGIPSFDIKPDYYAKHSVGIKKILCDIGNSISTRSSKEKVLNIFSETAWKRLSPCERELHSLKDCEGCLSDRIYKTGLSLFPVNKKARALYSKAKKYGLIRDNKKRQPLVDITNLTKRQLEEIKRQTVKECETIRNSSAINRYVIVCVYYYLYS